MFSTGAAPYNAFSRDYSSSLIGRVGYDVGHASGLPGVEHKPFGQGPDSADSLANRSGSWPATSVDTIPALTSGLFGTPTPGSATSVRPEDVRRLTRVNSSNSAFASGSTPVPYLPSQEFEERFGMWHGPPAGGSMQASRPIGVFADEPPSYLIPPPIWGLEDRSRMHTSVAEEELSRWTRSNLRQD